MTYWSQHFLTFYSYKLKALTQNQQIAINCLFCQLKYNLSISMYLNISPSLFLFLVVSLSIINSQTPLVDFSYAEHQVEDPTSYQRRITIKPDSSILGHYEFPRACSIKEFTNFKSQSQQQLPEISNIDAEIELLKERTTQFLQLSNQIQLIAKNLKGLPQLVNDESLNISEQQLNRIAEYETRLIQINDHIREKGSQLQKIIRQISVNGQNPLFKKAELSFQKRSLQKKVVLFKTILSSSKEVSTSEFNQKLQKYFKQLQQIFDSEDSTVATILQLLKNYSQLITLRQKIQSQKLLLVAQEERLAEKQQCENNFKRMQKRKSKAQIHAWISKLKYIKQNFNHTIEVCQGVVIKLISYVKSTLSAYDLQFICAEGIDELRDQIKSLNQTLNQHLRKLKELEGSNIINDFKQLYKYNRNKMEIKLRQLSSFTHQQFRNSRPDQIKQLIAQFERRSHQIDTALVSLPSSGVQNFDQKHTHINTKIAQIKELKLSYCQQNSAYERQSKLISEKMFKLEQQEAQNSWVGDFQLQKLKQLQTARKRMKIVQGEIKDLLGGR